MENDSPEISGLKDLTEWVNNFCDINQIKYADYSIEYSSVMNMAHEEIMSLSSEECFSKALVLMNYASFIQKKLDIMSAQLHWCNEALLYLQAKLWSDFDKYIPSDVKRKSICIENSYALEVEKQTIRISAAVNTLSSLVSDIKKRVSLLQDLGKRKNFG